MTTTSSSVSVMHTSTRMNTPLSAQASTRITPCLSAPDAGLQKLVLTSARSFQTSSETQAELEGQLGQRSAKKYISFAKLRVILQSPAPVNVRAVGMYTVELGGQENIVSRANQQNYNSKGEGRTLRMLERTNGCEVTLAQTSSSTSNSQGPCTRTWTRPSFQPLDPSAPSPPWFPPRSWTTWISRSSARSYGHSRRRTSEIPWLRTVHRASYGHGKG
jgi:hypothetical protein